MELLCRVEDRSNIENESEYYEYLATLREKNEKSLYEKHTINNIKLDEVDKILNDYISIHNRKFDIFLLIVNIKQNLIIISK